MRAFSGLRWKTHVLDGTNEIAKKRKCGLLNQSHTGSMIDSVLRFRSSQTRVPQNDANFGIGTLATPSRRPAMRPSRRQPDELRAVSLERGVVKYAEGSCFVKFGDTHVLV